jgi:hypothetical protein
MYNCKSWWALPWVKVQVRPKWGPQLKAEQVPPRASTTTSELRSSRCRPEQVQQQCNRLLRPAFCPLPLIGPWCRWYRGVQGVQGVQVVQVVQVRHVVCVDSGAGGAGGAGGVCGAGGVSSEARVGPTIEGHTNLALRSLRSIDKEKLQFILYWVGQGCDPARSGNSSSVSSWVVKSAATHILSNGCQVGICERKHNVFLVLP